MSEQRGFPSTRVLSGLTLILLLVAASCAAPNTGNNTPSRQPLAQSGNSAQGTSHGSTGSTSHQPTGSTAPGMTPAGVADEFTQPSGAQRLNNPAYAPTAAFTYSQNVASATETWQVPGTSHDALIFYANHLPSNAKSSAGPTYSDAQHTIQGIDVSFSAASFGGNPTSVQIGATDEADAALVSIYVEMNVPYRRPPYTVIGALTGAVTLRNTDANDALIGKQVTVTASQAIELVHVINASSVFELYMCTSTANFYPKHIVITFITKDGPIVVKLSSPPICGAGASLSARDSIIGLHDDKGILAVAKKIAPQFII